MRRPYIYNEEYINLGDIGEHELQITALRVSDHDDPVRLMIVKAVAFVVVGQSMQLLDVTDAVRIDPDWVDRVALGYKKAQQKEWNEETA